MDLITLVAAAALAGFTGGLMALPDVPEGVGRSGGYLRIGFGGAYNAHNSSDSNVNSYMGTLSIDVRAIGYERLQSGIEIRGGYGVSRVGDSNISLKNGRVASWDFKGRIGFNAFSKKHPLYINAIYTDSIFGGGNSYSGLKFTSNEHIAYRTQAAGAEFDGRLKVGAVSFIEYVLGYSYVFNATGSLPNNSTDFSINNGHLVNVSLGFVQDINPKLLYFIKANATYLNLSSFGNNGASYPMSHTYTAGIETGIGF